MTTGELSPSEQRRGDPDRVKAFSDGVFAIIITILVLDISVPADLPEQSLREALGQTGPEMVAWVISFGVTAMYWVWHRDLFNRIRRVNRDVVWLNLLLLLPAALIPFAASVLGQYHDEAIALHLYGVVLIAVSALRWLLYGYVMRRPSLLWEPVTPRRRRIGGLLAGSPIIVYVVAMVVAGAAPTVSLGLYLAMPLIYFVFVAVLRQRPETREAAEDFA